MEPPVRVTISAPVYPTEGTDRVAAAIVGLFPQAEVSVEGPCVSAVLPDASALGEIIQRLRIPDTARAQLRKGRTGPRTVVFLNKQAAVVGRLNFAATPGPLGDIRLEVTAPDDGALERFILEVAPDTTVAAYKDPGHRDPDLSVPGGPYSTRKPAVRGEEGEAEQE